MAVLERMGVPMHEVACYMHFNNNKDEILINNASLKTKLSF